MYEGLGQGPRPEPQEKVSCAHPTSNIESLAVPLTPPPPPISKLLRGPCGFGPFLVHDLFLVSQNDQYLDQLKLNETFFKITKQNNSSSVIKQIHTIITIRYS